jgi:tetratricopeptide (TPR) repeat protein
LLGWPGGRDAGAQSARGTAPAQGGPRAPGGTPPAQSGLKQECTQYQNPDLAIRACSNLISRYPNTASLYNARGNAYAAQKEYDRAIADYSEAIRLNPQYAVAYYNRGNGYLNKHDYDRAIADLNESLRLDPRYILAYTARCGAHNSKGEYDRAIADCSEAIRLYPSAAGAYTARCTTYLFKGEYDRAMADCNEAIRLNPSLAGPLNNRGVLYTRKGDYDHAIADLNEAIRLNPKVGGFYRNRGTAHTGKGDFVLALLDHNEAIRLDPASPIPYVRRGQMWEAKGERLKAIEDYVKALALPAPTQQARDEQADARRRLAPLQAWASLPPPQIVAPPPKVEPPPPKEEPPPSKIAPPPPKVAPAAVPPPPAPPPPSVVPPPPPTIPLGRRVALAIGNAVYRKVDPLPNSRKDAADIAAALKATGFTEVIEQHDLGLKEMQRALAAFEEKATGADWAVVYYGGHAIQMDGKNYLVPVDAEIKSPSDVEDETIVLDRVLARIAAAGKLRLVILDACRSNPFRRTWSGTKTRAVGDRGLARVEPKEPNVLIAYAAADGEAALDGQPGENSPYVKALLKHLAMPGLELGKLFRLVRDEVMTETGSKQRPFEYGSLSGEDLFFRAASR